MDTEKNLSSSKLLNIAPRKEQTALGGNRAERKQGFQKVSMNQFNQTSTFPFSNTRNVFRNQLYKMLLMKHSFCNHLPAIGQFLNLKTAQSATVENILHYSPFLSF